VIEHQIVEGGMAVVCDVKVNADKQLEVNNRRKEADKRNKSVLTSGMLLW
jgi:hypothetical protein